MKRSEAVHNIRELIESNLDILKEIPDATLVADLILYHLEQKGMAPPPHQEEHGTGHADEYGMEETCIEWVQGWEAE